MEKEEKFDPGFGKNIKWDIPLLEGYDYAFVKNISGNPGSKSYSGIDNPTLISEIEDWHADAVLIFGWKFKSHWRAIRYFHEKKPVLFRGDSTTLDDPHGFKGLIRYWGLRRVYKNILFALYTGTENKKYFLKAGVSENKLVFTPHAIDNGRFQCASPKNNFRLKLGIPEGDCIFLFAGKLEAKKNPELLAKVFLDCNLKDTHLVFVGNGLLEDKLKFDYKNSSIHFLDFQNQRVMPEVFTMSDVFVLPSRGPGETWGLSVNEAMAAGKPVLVSDKCGCAADLVEKGVNGYTFKSGDEEDLKAKIRLLMDRKKDLKKMGERGREKIQNWSFEKIVTAVEEVVMRDRQ